MNANLKPNYSDIHATFSTVGVALTCFALVAATVGIKTGNRAYANNMFRLRGISFN